MGKGITIPEKGISERNTIIISLISGEITTFHDILSMEDGETHVTIYIDETEDETRNIIVPKNNIAYIATAVRKTSFSDFAERVIGGREGTRCNTKTKTNKEDENEQSEVHHSM